MQGLMVVGFIVDEILRVGFNQRTNSPVNAHLRSASYTNKHI